MKVIVDKLPSQCVDCRFRHKDLCCITNDYVSHKDCPLQSITDYTEQVRKELMQEIKNKIEQAKMIYEWQGKEITIEDILNQIQGEPK